MSCIQRKTVKSKSRANLLNGLFQRQTNHAAKAIPAKISHLKNLRKRPTPTPPCQENQNSEQHPSVAERTKPAAKAAAASLSAPQNQAAQNSSESQLAIHPFTFLLLQHLCRISSSLSLDDTVFGREGSVRKWPPSTGWGRCLGPEVGPASGSWRADTPVGWESSTPKGQLAWSSKGKAS